MTAWFRGLASELAAVFVVISGQSASGKINFYQFDCDFPPKKPFCCGFGVFFCGSISEVSQDTFVFHFTSIKLSFIYLEISYPRCWSGLNCQH